MYNLYSTLFLEQDVDQYNCYVNEELWKRITNDLMANRILIRFSNGDKFWICSLGHPIYTSFDSNNCIYVPKWMLDQVDFVGVGESVEIDLFPSDIFDYSTKIILKALDSHYYVDDIQDVLSNELTKLAVLKKDTVIEVNMPHLDRAVKFEVVGLEPASVVLCEGDEVTLEFVTDVVVPTRLPTPYPFETVEPLLQEVEPSAPTVESAPTLGGTQRAVRYNPWRDKAFKPINS